MPEVYHEHEPPGTVLGYDDVGKDKGNAYKQRTKLSTFDNDARVVLAALKELADDGSIEPSVVADAIRRFEIDPDAPMPTTV